MTLEVQESVSSTPAERHYGAALHLPVAPRCNVQCAFCRRGAECVQKPSPTPVTKLLTPQQALSFALESLRREPRIASVGVSGPGDPLANPEATFATLALLRAERPDVPLFVVTNGYAVVDHVDQIVSLGVSLAIITVNAIDSVLVSQLVEWVHGPDGLVVGEDAAQLLITRQLDGIRALSARGVTVRVVCNLVSGVDPSEVAAVARAAASAGARFIDVRRPPSSRENGAEQTAVDDQELLDARVAAGRHLTIVRPGFPGEQGTLGWLDERELAALDEALEASSRKQDEPARARPAALQAPSPAERSAALPQLQLLVRVARWLATSQADTLTTLRQVLEWLDEKLGLERAVVALVDASGEVVQAQVAHGFDTEQMDRMRYRPDEGITGHVYASGQPIFLPSLAADPDFLDRSQLRVDLDLSRLAYYCVPIRDGGTVIGTLSADKDNRHLKDADSDISLLQEVAQLLAPFVQRRRLEESLALFQRLRATEGPFARLIGRSPAMDEVRRLIAKVALAATSVLLTGETGTGKSAAAALVHELSPNRTGPFVEVNCGAIPEALIESELFGHEKGAFTGAVRRRAGVFERARGGTVFLDEVGELAPSAQTRLLHVLQTRRFERVGGSETLTTDARLVAATNRDLAKAVTEGSFRTDLYYRLSVFPIAMPSLRERGQADVMLLADSFADRFGRAMDKPIFRIDTPAIDMLTAYHWPGNVRELENAIERAVVLAEGDVIHGHHLPPSLQLDRYATQPEDLDFQRRVAKFETELITEALKDAGGNQTKAAERLGLTKRVIQYKIRSYGIPWQRFLPNR